MTGASCRSSGESGSDGVAVQLPIGIANCNFGDANSEATGHSVDEDNHDGEHEHVACVLTHEVERILDRVDWFIVALRVKDEKCPEQKEQTNHDVTDAACDDADK